MGTIINTIGIILGSLIGLFLKKGIGDNLKDGILKALGLSTLVIGLMGTINNYNDDGLLLISSLLIGTVAGELLAIEDRLDRLGARLKILLKREGDGNFVEGFVNTTILVCVGAMSIIGAINDGIRKDMSILLAKTVLDTVAAIIFTSTFGIGAMLSAVPLFLYQGSITVAANWVAPLIKTEILNDISMVGGILISAIALNMIIGKKIKAANMLPSLFVPLLYHLVIYFIK